MDEPILKAVSGLLSSGRSESGQLQKSVSGDYRTLSDQERLAVVNRHYQPATGINPGQKISDYHLIEYLRGPHEHSANFINDVERLKVLAPEIDRAKNVTIPSILSPNDVQIIDPMISIDDITGLSADKKKEIEEFLYDEFIKGWDLAETLKKWCTEALFRSGSVPIFILPEATLSAFMGTTQRSATESYSLHSQSGMESFSAWYNSDNTDLEGVYNTLLKKPIFSKPKSKIRSSNEGLLLNGDSTSIVDPHLKAAVESIVKEDWEEDKYTAKNRLAPTDTTFSTALETITAKLITELEDGDTIHISENPEVLRFGSMVKAKHKSKLGKSLIEQYQPYGKDGELIQGYNAGGNQMEYSTVMDLTAFVDSSMKSVTDPFKLELPAEAVVPVCVPGTTDEKLGYWVLIDIHGQPIQAEKYLNNVSMRGNSSLASSSYNAMFGIQNQNSKPVFSSLTKFGNPWDMQEQAYSKVFNQVLDTMMHKKLENVGLKDVSFGKYSTIATCMLYRFLEKKKCSLVFVPEELVTYFAFDYRPDGTGKSKIENIMFLLSVRTSLIVSNMLAAMRNSVARKQITISVDPKETNPERLLEEAFQSYLTKNKLHMSTDPTAISDMINRQNVSIRLEGHNANGFQVASEDTHHQVPKADAELLEDLTSGIVNQLGVPHAVLNELGQSEFSRSVATTNLFYAQEIRDTQKTVCAHTNRCLRTYTKFSTRIKMGIVNILNGSNHDHATSNIDGDPMTASDVGGSVKNTTVAATLHKIINSITVSLPAPNIAPTKSQHEVLGGYVQVVKDVIDMVYPMELISSDSELSETYNDFRAYILQITIKQLIEQSGIGSFIELKNADDYMMDANVDIPSLHQTLRNLKNNLEQTKVVTTTDTDSLTQEGADSTDPGTSGDDIPEYNF